MVFFACLDTLGDGMIRRLEAHYGQPSHMLVEQSTA
jgi:hypothetical protein